MVYSSVQEIYADIIDLAGVRVALYFPAEKDQVERAILRLFDQRRNPKRFPEEGRKRKGRIFRGYSADHYRISLKPQSLRKPQKRFAEALVEVQVASVLMHYITRPNAADQYQEKPRGRPRRAAPLATPWRVTAAPPSGTTGRRCGVVGRLVTSRRWAWV